MTYQIRDLMFDVLPTRIAGGCGPSTVNMPPQPCPDPSCAYNSAKPPEDRDEDVCLPALATLRAQVRAALLSGGASGPG
jgi:hypothetical protein